MTRWIGKVEIIDWPGLEEAIKDYYNKQRKYWTTEIEKIGIKNSTVYMWGKWTIKRITWDTEDKLKELDIDLSKYLKPC